jgi:hypothetical protein
MREDRSADDHQLALDLLDWCEEPLKEGSKVRSIQQLRAEKQKRMVVRLGLDPEKFRVVRVSTEAIDATEVVESPVVPSPSEVGTPEPKNLEPENRNVVEADEIQAPVPKWQSEPAVDVKPAQPPTPPKKEKPPVDIGEDAKSVAPLTEADWEKVNKLTTTFASRLLGNYHRLDYVPVLDASMKRLREIRRDYRNPD